MIRLTHDMDVVNSILHKVWGEIDEGDPFDVPSLLGVAYYVVNEGDGIICFHPFRDGLKIHPNILPEKRGKLAYEAIEESIQRAFDHGWLTIYAEIPARLKHVLRCAKDLGFNLLESGERDLFVRRRLDS